MNRCEFYIAQGPRKNKRMKIGVAEYFIRSTNGPRKIYWRCLGCDSSAKSSFGFAPGAGVFAYADLHNPGCPSLQQEAEMEQGLEEPFHQDALMEHGLEVPLLQEAQMEPGLEEAPMEPPIAAVRRSRYSWAFLGCSSLVYLAYFMFNNYIKIENDTCYIIYYSNCD